MEHHETLAAMERVCDHMLQGKWYTPAVKPGVDDNGKTKAVPLLNQILEATEKVFADAFPHTIDYKENIPENYYKIVEGAKAVLAFHASNLLSVKHTSELLIINAYYEAHSKVYVVTDLIIRPCIWETGIARQITQVLVQALDATTEKPALKFELDFGYSFMVSLTIEDMKEKGIFTKVTAEKDEKRGKVQVYIIHSHKFQEWKNAFEQLPNNIKGEEPWAIADLINKDSPRLDHLRALFKSSVMWQNIAVGGWKLADTLSVFKRSKF
jgi:hypothetical protein